MSAALQLRDPGDRPARGPDWLGLSHSKADEGIEHHVTEDDKADSGLAVFREDKVILIERRCRMTIKAN